MYATELHSFIQKFNNLWNAGFTAHLDIDSHDGFAWIGLHLQLGQQPALHPEHHQVGPRNPQKSRNKNNPSRQRRRATRKAERAAKAAEDIAIIEVREVDEVHSEYVQNPTNNLAEVTTDVDKEAKNNINKDEVNEVSDKSLIENNNADDNLDQVSTNDQPNTNLTISNFRSLLFANSNTLLERRSQERKEDMERFEELMKQSLRLQQHL